MKIIIVGDGKVGIALTRQLSREGHDIVVIDSDPRALEQTAESFDIMVLQGNGASMSVLHQAGIASADLLIAATSADEINLLCCLTAKKMSNVHTIARVRNPDYADQLVQMREELGLSMTVNPELAAAREIFHLLQLPSFLNRETFAKGRVEIVALKIKPGSPLCNVPLNRMNALAGVKVLVCAVERKDQVFIPRGDFILREGDHIHVTAQASSLATLIENLGITTHKIRYVMLTGGGHIAQYLAAMLLNSGICVKIIEKDPARCIQLSELLPDASIIEADASLQQVLLDEGIESTDAVVTLTSMDEENLVISMFANHLGVPKVVTKINRLEYTDVFADMGIGSIVSPKELCTTDIVRYVRAMQNTTGSGVLTLHRIVNSKAEALEFRVSSDCRHRDIPLKDIRLRDNVLISCITHGGKTIIPDGQSSFTIGDTVIVVTTSERPFQRLNDIFA
ncbi:MAG: Trk system potassium transporter TrkA [Oscillospiraceae bacterium]|nr:Trk system potassium transporter TrkA [Oscillospiraceae bacterium]